MGADSGSHAYKQCQMRLAWSNCCYDGPHAKLTLNQPFCNK